MKSTRDLIAMFSKNIENGRLSAKQAKWLFSVANKEGLLCNYGGYKTISLDLVTYNFHELNIPCAAYGGYVGSKGKSGNWAVEKSYLIRYKETGIKIYVDNLKELDGYEYERIEPSK